MKYRLTKKAQYVLYGGIAITLLLGAVFGYRALSKENKEETKDFTVDTLVVENTILKVELVTFISEKDYQEGVSEETITIDKGEVIRDITISKKQTFTKIVELLPPNPEIDVINNGTQLATHNAYIFVLVGDIVKNIDKDGNEEYQIVNSRIEYHKQKVLLETEYDSVFITSLDGTKEKLIKLSDYKDIIKDVNRYLEVLQW